MSYAQRDMTAAEIERDQIITSEEYHIGYSEGWTQALAWAGFTDSADAAEHRKPIRSTSTDPVKEA